MANSMGNIGIIYYHQTNYPLALKYYFKALKKFEQLANKSGMASSYTNIGILYTVLCKKYNNDNQISDGLTLQKSELLLDTALDYQLKAFELNKEHGYQMNMVSTLSGIGSIKVLKNNYPQAIKYYKQATQLADSIGASKECSHSHKELSTCYEKTGEYQNALVHYKLYSILIDSIFNEEKSKDIGKLEAKHECEVEEAARKKQEEKVARIEAEQKARHNNLQYSAIGIGLILLFIGIFFLGNIALPAWVVEISIFIPILLLFEFALVYLDPHIEAMTGGEPAYKLLMNAGIAAVIFPIHQFFESRMKKRIFKVKRQQVTAKQQKDYING